MKRSHLLFALLFSLTTISLGCGKKDEKSDKATADKPAEPAAPGAPAEPAPTKSRSKGTFIEPAIDAASLPAECKAFIDAIEAVSTCDQIPKPTQDSIKAGNKMLLKTMIDAREPKMIQGCLDGIEALKTMRASAGC